MFLTPQTKKKRKKKIQETHKIHKTRAKQNAMLFLGGKGMNSVVGTISSTLFPSFFVLHCDTLFGYAKQGSVENIQKKKIEIKK